MKKYDYIYERNYLDEFKRKALLLYFILGVVYFVLASMFGGFRILDIILFIGGILVLQFILDKLDFIYMPFVNQFFKAKINMKESELKKTDWLTIGRSMGWLDKHARGLAKNQNIGFELEDLCQNFVCFGGTGSGKTSRFMYPMLFKLLNNYQNQNIGGLIFDVKGDFGKNVNQIFDYTKKKVLRIGLNSNNKFNILKGISPELSSTYLKSIFYISGAKSSDSFLIDSAVELCKNSLGILSQVKGAYTLNSLYLFILNDNYRKDILAKADSGAKLLNDREKRIFETYKSYYTEIFEKNEDRFKTSIKSTIAQALSNFQHPDLVDCFSNPNAENINLEKIFNGEVFIIDLPLSTWGSGAKLIYTLIKLRFFSLVQNRPNVNDETPVFFMCDEYQELISANQSDLSDLNFWDKSRSARCIGIVSCKSISSLNAALNNDYLANSILQNFRQKFVFNTEDNDTIKYFQDLLGSTEVLTKSYTNGTSKKNTDWIDKTYHQSETRSLQVRQVLSSQLIRALSQNTAVAFMTIQGLAYDDVLEVRPYWELLK